MRLKTPVWFRLGRVRLEGPIGMSVQILSGGHVNVASDGTLELADYDAQPLLRNAGWRKLGEWCRSGGARRLCRCSGLLPELRGLGTRRELPRAKRVARLNPRHTQVQRSPNGKFESSSLCQPAVAC